MSDHEQELSAGERREQARERLNEAIGNGQVHPAVADFLAILDDGVQGVSERHDALFHDLYADKSPGDAEDTADDKAPAETNTPTPARVAATKATTTKGSTR